MKLVIQRVGEASVEVEEKTIAKIGNGMLILVGFGKDDDEDVVKKTAQKVLKLRIFPDDHRDINRSVEDVGGEILAVSQFTLLADTSGGNRPSFIQAAEPELAQKLFNVFVQELQKSGIEVKTGEFGTHMKVYLINDGPVTIIYE
ncbi:D-aminoacyl-tRNA deacylase [Patescibacteria group bacterium AH-259-L07]|nr:D-aminoacyl-tRNA deacylase [Patescibacteria group bacterium AH-259-L07]